MTASPMRRARRSCSSISKASSTSAARLARSISAVTPVSRMARTMSSSTCARAAGVDAGPRLQDNGKASAVEPAALIIGSGDERDALLQNERAVQSPCLVAAQDAREQRERLGLTGLRGSRGRYVIAARRRRRRAGLRIDEHERPRRDRWRLCRAGARCHIRMCRNARVRRLGDAAHLGLGHIAGNDEDGIVRRVMTLVEAAGVVELESAPISCDQPRTGRP